MLETRASTETTSTSDTDDPDHSCPTCSAKSDGSNGAAAQGSGETQVADASPVRMIGIRNSDGTLTQGPPTGSDWTPVYSTRSFDDYQRLYGAGALKTPSFAVPIGRGN